MSDTHRSDLSILGRVLREAKPYWLHIAALFLLSLAAAPLALLQPLPLKIAVDSVLGGHPLPGFLEGIVPESVTRSRMSLLGVSVALVLAVAVLNQFRIVAASLLRVHTGQQLLLRFRAKLFGHVQRLSLSFHDTRGATDSIYRIQSDAPAIEQLAVEGFMPFVTAAATLVATFYVMFRLDATLALVALATAPVAVTLSYFRRRYVRPRYRAIKAMESSTQGVLHEVLSSLRVVKAFAQEDREEQRYVNRASEAQDARLRLTYAQSGFGMLTGMTTAAGRAGVLFVGVTHVLAGTLTLGELLIVMGYLTQLYGPLQTLTNKPTQLQSNLVSADRAFALLDEAPDVMERPGARALKRAKGAVSFRDVTFGYGEARTILDDVSFDVPAGARVGILGTTGSGKTTVASLLLRFYDPTRGAILVDGIDLRDYKVDDLRHQFAIVLQEPVLFSGTIADNIAYARPGASEEEIAHAAQAANAHEFIKRLPAGYQTLVGERGMQLSGGERQRISLARAFLKDAAILILDEPTSSVDVRTEDAIIDAMERLMQGRTSFMITHRTAALRNCDVLLHFEDGRLVSPAYAAV